MSQPVDLYVYRVVSLVVVDGDTVDAVLDLGHNVQISERYRLYGINAPEMKTDEGKAAKEAAQDWVESREGFPLYIQTIKYKTKDKEKKGKYGRYLAIVMDGEDRQLNQWMVATGHAAEKEY
ncbi:MAG: thermonuclease family protein [bacterium]